MSPSLDKSGTSPRNETEGNKPQRAHDGNLGEREFCVHGSLPVFAKRHAVVLYRFSSRRDACRISPIPSPRLPSIVVAFILAREGRRVAIPDPVRERVAVAIVASRRLRR